MTTDWVRQLEYLSKWVGFTMNPEMRAQNMALNNAVHENTPAWVLAQHGHDDVLTDPASPLDLRAEFEAQIHDLGPMRAFLYNMGMSHIMTSATVESFTDKPENTAIGEFLYGPNMVITEDRINDYGDEESVIGVARHEAGHGFSFNSSPVPFLRQTIIQDIEQMDLDRLRPEQREIVEEFLREEYPSFHENRPFPNSVMSGEVYQRMGCIILADALKDDPTLRAHFPNTSPLFEDLHLYTDDPLEFLPKISEHPAIKDAYRDDLLDILEGRGPHGARIEVREIEFRGKMDERALIITGEGDTEIAFNAHHYLPKEFQGYEIGGSHTMYENEEIGFFNSFAIEEALADTFEDVLADEAGMEDLATYFPRLAEEVSAIKDAIYTLAEQERAIDAAPSRDNNALPVIDFNKNFSQ